MEAAACAGRDAGSWNWASQQHAAVSGESDEVMKTYINDVAGARALALAKVPAVGFERAVLYPVADSRSIVGYGA